MPSTEAPWGVGRPPFIIAEIGLTHEGSLGNALAFIDACADVGASAVKFQCHDGDENCDFRPGYVWPQDNNRQDYWRRTAFAFTEWCRLAAHARQRNILLGITPFSVGAVWLILRHCNFLKISRQNLRSPIHDACIVAREMVGVPLLWTGDHGLGLDTYKHGLHIGISSHAPNTAMPQWALQRGAQVAELHVCWDRRQFGPDVQYSVTIDELAELVRAVR